MRVGPWLLAAAGTVIIACSSAPVRLHTLLPVTDEKAAEEVHGARVLVGSSVHIPPMVDRRELVIREPQGGTVILENELWIAPLEDELRAALDVELDEQLRRVPGAADEVVQIRTRLEVRRFEGAPGRYALMEAQWRVTAISHASEHSVLCTSRIAQSAGPGVGGLVVAYQHVVISTSDRIALAARALLQSQPGAACHE